MKILGISAFYHDAAAALIEDGNIIAAAQEERFTRKKHDSSFPINAIRYCLDYADIRIEDLDAIAFYDKPLLKFERLLETYYGFAPKGLSSFVMAIPIWLNEKMFLKRLIWDNLGEIQAFDKKKVKLLFPEHHLSHAASAFYSSSFKKAAILTLDGVGEWATASISSGDANKITILKELKFPHSVGLLYSAFTYFLGFRVNSGEYKMMGLAPYGNPESEQFKSFVEIITSQLVDVKDDGSIKLNLSYFTYPVGLRMVDDKKWAKLFGIPKRLPEDKLDLSHCNMALAIQKVTEDIVIKMAREAKRITGDKNLCLAGGVALNCVANGKIYGLKEFDNIFIQPAAGDAGGALGAAQAAYHIYFEKDRIEPKDKPDIMKGAYLGPEYSDIDIQKTARRLKAPYHSLKTTEELCEKVANLIHQGKVVGWMQGRMEFGPRALGARSIMGDPTNPEMQKRLNIKIKQRESFRPFAPSVLAEDCNKYFKLETSSPYMLVAREVNDAIRLELPSNFGTLNVKEKLYSKRSLLPAITHVDFTARIQTVHKETNPKYWSLLKAFKNITGYGVLINTSFNVRGEPIVCTPEDAYRCFMRTEMDFLVMNNFIFDKSEQPEREKADWIEKFDLD
jgi:carbamoyltransferase